MKNYYTIGEISKIYGIGKDSLMYYEALGILQPMRNEKGYRFYSVQEIWRLNLIKELRSLDMPMKRIKTYVEMRDIHTTKEMLKEEQALVKEKIAQLKKYEKNIKHRLENIEQVLDEPIGQIEEKWIGKRKVLLFNANITKDAEVDILMQKMQQQYEKQFDVIGGTNVGALFQIEAFEKGIYNIFQSAFCIMEERTTKPYWLLQEGLYLTYTYKGDYQKNGVYIQQMLTYMKKHQYCIAGTPLELYKLDIHETSKEEEYTTEIQIPIEKQ